MFDRYFKDAPPSPRLIKTFNDWKEALERAERGEVIRITVKGRSGACLMTMTAAPEARARSFTFEDFVAMEPWAMMLAIAATYRVQVQVKLLEKTVP